MKKKLEQAQTPYQKLVVINEQRFDKANKVVKTFKNELGKRAIPHKNVEEALGKLETQLDSYYKEFNIAFANAKRQEESTRYTSSNKESIKFEESTYLIVLLNEVPRKSKEIIDSMKELVTVVNNVLEKDNVATSINATILEEALSDYKKGLAKEEVASKYRRQRSASTPGSKGKFTEVEQQRRHSDGEFRYGGDLIRKLDNETIPLAEYKRANYLRTAIFLAGGNNLAQDEQGKLYLTKQSGAPIPGL